MLNGLWTEDYVKIVLSSTSMISADSTQSQHVSSGYLLGHQCQVACFNNYKKKHVRGCLKEKLQVALDVENIQL